MTDARPSTQLYCIANLLAEHRRIDSSLKAFRLALLDRSAESSRAAYAEFASLLQRHLRIEDELVIPALQSRASSDTERTPLAQIQRDHRLIESHLVEVEAALESLDRSSVDAAERAQLLVALHDRLSALHHLLEHHDQREAEHLEPVLDALMSPLERRALLDEVEARLNVPEPSPAALPSSSPLGVDTWVLADPPVAGECSETTVAPAAHAVRWALTVGDEVRAAGWVHWATHRMDAQVRALANRPEQGDERKRMALTGHYRNAGRIAERLLRHLESLRTESSPRNRGLMTLRAYDSARTWSTVLQRWDESLH